jgi:hypothetical protein
MSTEGRTSSENWFEWLFGHGEQHAYSKSEFVYKTYSSRRSSASGPGISSKDIAQFVNSLGNFKWYSRDSQVGTFFDPMDT